MRSKSLAQEISNLLEAKISSVALPILEKQVHKWFALVLDKNRLSKDLFSFHVDPMDTDYDDLLIIMLEGKKKETWLVYNDFLSLMQSELKKYGWFVAKYGETFVVDPEGSDYIFYLSPNYGVQVKPPKLIYHATLEKNVNVIQKKGLVPKAASSEDSEDHWQYPPRVFFRTRDDKSLYTFKGYVLLVIDTEKLSGVKFYRDATDDDAIWTYTHISPTAVVEVKSLAPDSKVKQGVK